MRDVRVIIAHIINIIPYNTNDKFSILKIKLHKMLQSMCYSPPEKIFSSYYWNITSEELNHYISLDDYNNIDWAKEAIDIFRNTN